MTALFAPGAVAVADLGVAALVRRRRPARPILLLAGIYAAVAALMMTAGSLVG